MLLRTFKSNSAANFIILPLVGLLLWASSFLSADAYDFYLGENSMLLFKPINRLTELFPLVSKILALAILVGNALLMLRLNTRFLFIRVRTFMPAAIFLLITSAITPLHFLLPAYIAAFFVLLSLGNIFAAFHEQKSQFWGFNAGFALGVGALFYQNIIGFLPAIWIGLLTVKKSRGWRDVVTPILGVLTPLLLAFSWFYLTDNLIEMKNVILQNITTKRTLIRGDLSLQIYLAFVVLLTIIGSLFMVLKNFDEKKVSSRKFFTVLFWMFINSLLILVAIPSVSAEFFIIMALPLSYLIANYFVFIKNRIISSILFYTLLALVIYMQFV